MGTPAQLDSKRFIADRVRMTAEPTPRVLHAQRGESWSGTHVTSFHGYVAFLKACVLWPQRTCVEICISCHVSHVEMSMHMVKQRDARDAVFERMCYQPHSASELQQLTWQERLIDASAVMRPVACERHCRRTATTYLARTPYRRKRCNEASCLGTTSYADDVPM